MIRVPASIIVSRSSGRDDDKCVHITITDEVSGCRVLEMAMSLEQWANAGFSSYGYGDMEYFDDVPIGKKREVKEEVIEVPDIWSDDKGWMVEVIKPYEVDGWKCARKDDLTNMHRRVGKNKQKVLFVRYM